MTKIAEMKDAPQKPAKPRNVWTEERDKGEVKH